MRHVSRIVSVSALAATAWLLVAPVRAQNENQYDQNQRQYSQSDDQQYDQRSENQQNRVREDSSRSWRDNRQQSDDRSQDRFGRSRDELRDNQRRDSFRDERMGRRQERRDSRSNSDEPAGLGVMLDMSQDEVEVRDVARNSPADRAGIQRGDQIVSVDGQRIESPQQLTRIIQQEQPGSQIDIRIRRDGQQRTVTARLESLQQALDTMDRYESDQWQEQQFYSNSPPWSDDELMTHVDNLERQVRRMQQEIENLRSMLDNDPSQQRFSQRPSQDQSRFRD